MTSIASSKNWEHNIFLDSGDCSKEGRRVADKLLYLGTVGIDEGNCDGRVSFIRRNSGREPLRWVNEGEAFADWVPFQFVD